MSLAGPVHALASKFQMHERTLNISVSTNREYSSERIKGDINLVKLDTVFPPYGSDGEPMSLLHGLPSSHGSRLRACGHPHRSNDGGACLAILMRAAYVRDRVLGLSPTSPTQVTCIRR